MLAVVGTVLAATHSEPYTQSHYAKRRNPSATIKAQPLAPSTTKLRVTYMSIESPAELRHFNAARREGTHISRGRARVLITLVAVGSCLALSASVAMSPLLLTTMGQFNTGITAATWTLTIVGLSAGLASVVLPRLSDSHGDKHILVFGALAIVVGALLSALSQGLFGLIVGQALTGFGTVGAYSGVGMIRRHLHDSYMGAAIAALTIGAGVGLGLGYLVGGLALEYVSLHGFFWIRAVVYAVYLLAIVALVPKDHLDDLDPSVRPNVVGTTMLGAWAILLLLAFGRGPDWGWLDWRTSFIGLSALIIAVAWFFHERRSAAPVFDPSLMKNPAVRGVLVGSFLLNASFAIWLVLAPTYLQANPDQVGYGLAMSLLQTGFAMLPEGIAFAIGCALAARAIERGRSVLWTAVGALFSTVGLIELAALQASLWESIIGFVLFGFGFGAFGTGVTGVLQSAVGEERAGMALSLDSVTSSLGSGFGGPIAAVALASFLLADGVTPSREGYLPGYLVAAALATIGGVVTLATYRGVRARR